ncbi:transcription factor bHLH30-like [Rhodamnia argentea]|uniref:Transcription factor bHLH30-like n=1 Tax=Rhodamnia argentea TaxID=178133 RepID=A0A8B8QJE6_9MYRT|nr:transcription factor bHLH30-like [Rhodamnia argentea]
MALYTDRCEPGLYGSDPHQMFDPFSRANGSVPEVATPQSLVLDGEKSELVIKAPNRVAKKNVSEEKALAALRNHSEAERRRRERINSHLATLRGLVPCDDKMDKATLLAHVIEEVKELKKKAAAASEGLLVPMDADEVKVEPLDDAVGNGTFSFKASICCEYRPELLSDLRQAIDALRLKIVKAEISTLESRLRNDFIFSSGKDEFSYRSSVERQLLASSIRQALCNVLAKTSISTEYSPRTTLPSKRRRVSFLDSSSPSL